MSWWDVIYDRVDQPEMYPIEHELDVIFGTFDGLFRAGLFDIADKLIAEVDVERLNTALLSGLLACTLAAKVGGIEVSQTPSRVTFLLTAIETVR